MKQQEKKEANGEKQHSKETITIAAPKEEWKDVESLITPYRQQWKAMKHLTVKLEQLTRFQARVDTRNGGNLLTIISSRPCSRGNV